MCYRIYEVDITLLIKAISKNTWPSKGMWLATPRLVLQKRIYPALILVLERLHHHHSTMMERKCFWTLYCRSGFISQASCSINGYNNASGVIRSIRNSSCRRPESLAESLFSTDFKPNLAKRFFSGTSCRKGHTRLWPLFMSQLGHNARATCNAIFLWKWIAISVAAKVNSVWPRFCTYICKTFLF